MKTRLFLLLIICSFVFSSCEETVDIKKTFGIEPQIVLYSRICPQADTNYAYVHHSLAFFSSRSYSSEVAPLSNATVEISNDEKTWIRFSYNEEKRAFVLLGNQISIEEGKTYHIRVACDGFETVTSSCTVPYMREVYMQKGTTMITCYGSSFDDNKQKHPHDVFRWTDYPDEENFYMLHAVYSGWSYITQYDEYGNPIIVDSTYYSYLSSIVDNNTNEEFFSDQGRDGKEIKVIDYHCEEYSGWIREDELLLTMMDKPCYLYEQSLWKYHNSMSSGMDMNLLSLFEPILIYSNIENGLGFFGAYTAKQYSIPALPQF